MSIGASVLTIMLLSIDRYVAIKHPVRHHGLSTPRYVSLSILLVWALSGAVMIPLGVRRHTEDIHLPYGAVVLTTCKETSLSEGARWAFEIFLVVFIYVIPGSV